MFGIRYSGYTSARLIANPVLLLATAEQMFNVIIASTKQNLCEIETAIIRSSNAN